MPEEDPKGIPEFWLTIFKSVDMLSDMLQVYLNALSIPHALYTFHAILKQSHISLIWLLPQEHDEPILKHLKDIQVKFSEPGQPMVSIIVLYQGIHVIVIKENSINVTRTCIVLFFSPHRVLH